MRLFAVYADPNKVLTFAGGPVVCEHEWNYIPRREQPYMSTIAGIIHDSLQLASLFLVSRIPETLQTRASSN